MPDLVDQFELYTKGIRTCSLYRKWGGIALVAGAMERRIIAKNDAYTNYPNLFVMLAGPPGSGKGIIDTVRRLWKATPNELGVPAFYVGVNNATKASLVDGLARAIQSNIPSFSYNCLLLPVEEFSDFFSTYDPSLLSFMTTIYNAPDEYEEERRGHGAVKINAPVMSAILGYQPDVMNKVLLKEGSDQGFMRRIILIWNRRPEKELLFTHPPLDEKLKNEILCRLQKISGIKGEMEFHPNAIPILQEWDKDNSIYPRPNHHNLVHYNETRTPLAIKLAMVASISESTEMIIHQRHVLRAIEWLLEAEKVMPEVFDNMKEQNSDYDIMQSLYAFALKWQSIPKEVTEGLLLRQMAGKIPSQRMKIIINTLELMGTLVRRKSDNPAYISFRVTHIEPKKE